jgi:hypothetical protein
MTRRSVPRLLAGCLACFVAGTLAGAWIAAPAQRPEEAPVVAGPRPPALPAREASETSSRRLARHREQTAEAHRWETMPVSQFPHELEALSRGFGTAQTIHRLLQQWAQRDAAGYAAYLVDHGDRLPIELGTSEYCIHEELIHALIPRAPAAAIAVLKDCPDLEDSDLWTCAESWRKKSPDTFAQLLTALGDRLAAESPGRGWWRTHDPVSLLPLFDQLPPGPALRDLAADGVSHFLEDPSADLTQASAWWHQLPAEYQSVAAEAFSESSGESEDTERTRALARALGLPAPGPAEKDAGNEP